VKDPDLTALGLPTIECGESYPLMFSVAGIKAWAEYKGISFTEALTEGWKGMELSDEDTALLLRLALSAGEKRRALYDASPPEREITPGLISRILEVMHPAELWVALVQAWSPPPAREPDPQTKTAAP